MSKRDRTCYVCGKKYEYCPTCGQDKHKPSWMSSFHNSNCKNISEICSKFNLELITREEAESELKKCDLTNKGQFAQYTRETIDKIFGASHQKQTKTQVEK